MLPLGGEMWGKRMAGDLPESRTPAREVGGGQGGEEEEGLENKGSKIRSSSVENLPSSAEQMGTSSLGRHAEQRCRDGLATKSYLHAPRPVLPGQAAPAPAHACPPALPVSYLHFRAACRTCTPDAAAGPVILWVPLGGN